MDVNFKSRPDLWVERDGEWFTVPERQDEAYEWLQQEQYRIRREIKAAKLAAKRAAKEAEYLARGSPTAVLRTLAVGELYAFAQYKHTSQVLPLVHRLSVILDREFRVTRDPFLDWVTVLRTR
mgnify:CR=1 FL=1